MKYKILILIAFLIGSVSAMGQQNVRGNSVWSHTTMTLDSTYTPTGTEPKGASYFDKANRTVSVPLGNGVVMQVNQEALVRVYNNTGDTLKDGRIIGYSEVVSDLPAVAYASNNERHTFLGATTENILADSIGLAVSLIGVINNVNTGSLTTGPIYLDSLGYLTNTRPTFPQYIYPLGVCLKVGTTDGIIQFRSDGVNYKNSILDAFDGAIRETFDFRTYSDGVNSYGVISNPTGANKLTLMFSDGWWDFMVPDTITLTAGTATNPQQSWVYIDKATKTLQSSTSGFPSDEHAEVAKLALLDAATTQTDGALRNQNTNNHLKYDDNNGHIVHMGDRIRVLNAQWEDGVAPTVSGTPTNFYISTTSGHVWQMHKQTFIAQDLTSGDDVHVVNDPTTPYRTTYNLNSITVYSDGTTWNNEWTNIVLWGVANKTGEASHLMVNLSSGGYLSEENAYDDADNLTNYIIPRAFRGVGFLIARFTVRRSPAGYTYNSSTGYLDLRGFYPNNTAGGGAGGSSGITDFTQLYDTPSSYVGSGGYFTNVTDLEDGLEFVAPSSIALTEFDSTGFKITASQVSDFDAEVSNNTTVVTNQTDIANLELKTDSIRNEIPGLATSADAQAGTDDLKYISPLKLNEVLQTQAIDEFQLTDSLNVVRDTLAQHRIEIDLNTLHRLLDFDTDSTNEIQDISGIAINTDSIVANELRITQNEIDIAGLEADIPTVVSSPDAVAGANDAEIMTAKKVNETIQTTVPRHKYNEIMTGAQNGSNTVFTTLYNFIVGSANVYMNGVLLTVGTHYTETASNTITFMTGWEPEQYDLIKINYIY